MLYNTPLEPGLQISVNTVKTNIASVGAFNTLYLLAYTGPNSNFSVYGADLITSLEDYKERIGGTVPTDYLGLVNYLSIAAAYKNMKGLGAIKIIPVRAPNLIYSLQTTVVGGVGTTGNALNTDVTYTLNINGSTLDATISIPTILPLQYTSIDNFIANEVAKKIRSRIELKSSIYIRDIVGSVIEITPVVPGQSLTFVSSVPTTGIPITITNGVGPSNYAIPEGKDYIQALELSLTPESELGVIVAPGFYATTGSLEAELFTKQLDSFCRQAEFQQLAIRDVVNPDLTYVPDYSTITTYNPTTLVTVDQLIEFEGSIYRGQLPPGNAYGGSDALLPVAVAINGQIGVLERALQNPVTINGVTGRVIRGLVSGAAITNVLAPTPVELLDFRVVSNRELINRALFEGSLIIVESGSATEQAIYKFRDNFDSIEGNVSIVAPYLNYLGSELDLAVDFALPASVYQASLWIYVANAFGVFTPPGSDDYALEGTKGPIWQVTSPGHALLNGKGINIIKTINSNAYVMGARTLSQNDIYNRQNARVILSLYVRTLRSALKAGLVIKPLTSPNAFLNTLKNKADAVSRSFYQAGLFYGGSESEAFNNKCDTELNPLSAIQQGIIKLESKFAQIGMTERIVVTVQESLLGALSTIL